MVKKRLKITGIVVLSVVVFVIAAAFLLPYIISADTYKGMIVSELQKVLKRDVSLGRLRITILPTLGAKIENVVISNPPDFSKAPLLSLDSVKVRVKIIPLLFGRKEIAALTLNHPVIFVEKNQQGRLNLPFMDEAGTTDQSNALQRLSLSQATIRGGKLIYLDRSAEPSRRTELEEIDLDISDLALGKTIKYKLTLHWSPGEVSLNGWAGPLGDRDLKNIPLEGKLKADFPALDGFMKKLAGVPEGTLQGALKADVNISGNTGSSLKMKGDVFLKNLAMGEKGARSIEGLDITVSPEADLSGKDGPLQLTAILQLDKTPFQIQGQFRDFSKSPVGRLTFTSQQGINLAEIGPKFPSLDRAVKLKGQLALAGELIVPAQGNPLLSLEANSARMDIALENKPTSRKQAAPRQKSGFDARGKVTIKEGKFQGNDFRDFLLTAEMKRGAMKITRFTCAAFEGTVEGDGSFNMVQEPSPFSLKTKVAGVDADVLLSSLTSAKGMMKGKLSGEAALGGTGLSVEAFKKNLTGTGEIQVKEGELTWLNLIGRIVQALGGKGWGKDKTTFDDLTSAFTIKDGMVSVPNLILSQKDIDLLLRGSIGLDSTLKMEGEAHLPSSVTGNLSGKGWKLFEDDKGRLIIPFTLQGALKNPKVEISTKLLEQGVKGLLEQYLKKKLKIGVASTLSAFLLVPEILFPIGANFCIWE